MSTECFVPFCPKDILSAGRVVHPNLLSVRRFVRRTLCPHAGHFICWKFYLLDVLSLRSFICWKFYLLEVLSVGSFVFKKFYLLEVLSLRSFVRLGRLVSKMFGYLRSLVLNYENSRFIHCVLLWDFTQEYEKRAPGRRVIIKK